MISHCCCAAFVSKRTLPPTLIEMLTISTYRRSRDCSSSGTWKKRPPNTELSSIFFPAKCSTTLYVYYRSGPDIVSPSDQLPELSCYSPRDTVSCGDTTETREENGGLTNTNKQAAESFLSDKSCRFDMHYRSSCTPVSEISNNLPCLADSYCSSSCTQSTNNTTLEQQQTRHNCSRNEQGC